MADSSSTSGNDYKLDSLTVSVKDALDELGTLVVQKTAFSGLKSSQIFSQAPSISGSDDLTLGNAALAVSGSATYDATAFTSATDTDPDAIVKTGPNDVWLKQELDLEVDVSGTEGPLTYGVGTVNASGSAKANLRLLDYRQHSLQDLVGKAVIDAIAGARFAVRAADVNQLDSGSRLAVLAGGSLALNVQISVADTLSASLPELDNLLGISAPIQFQTGGSCELAVGLSDDFRLVFSRATSGRIGVDVKKTTNSDIRVTGSYGVTAQFADPQAVSQALEAYITARLGVVYTDYQKLEKAVCDSNALADLPQTLQALAQQVAATLGISDLDTKFSDFKSKICGLGDKLSNKIQTVVSATVKAAFTITWSRVTSDETVLAFEIDPSALPDYLYDLVFGNLSPVVKALAAQDPRFTLINYLETRKETITFAFGFSLSLGKWSANSQTSFQVTWQTDKTILDGKLQERQALEGRYSYTSTWLDGKTETYFLDLAATMSGFAVTPALSDFQLGLHLSWTWQEKPSSSLAARWADLAELWGGQPALAGAATTSGDQDVTAAVDVVLSDDGVRAIVKAANQNDSKWRESWAWALATALPPISTLHFRTSVSDRQRLYLQSAQDLLKQNSAVEVVTVPQYTSTENTQLRPIDLGGLGQPLTGSAITFEMFSLRIIWRPDSATRRPSKLFEDTRQAFAALAHGSGYRSQIEGLIYQLNSVVSGDPFSMRLMGAALVRYLTQTGQTKLFTTSARYTVGNTTTLAVAGKS